MVTVNALRFISSGLVERNPHSKVRTVQELVFIKGWKKGECIGGPGRLMGYHKEVI